MKDFRVEVIGRIIKLFIFLFMIRKDDVGGRVYLVIFLEYLGVIYIFNTLCFY